MAPRTPRLAYLDNLRWSLVLLVVIVNTSLTYSHHGRWYYRAADALGETLQAVFLAGERHLQAFVMGLLFLIAGYFTPGAFDRKGLRRFAGSRLFRLGLPTLLYVFAIHHPLSHYLQHGTLDGVWKGYRYFVLNGDWVDGTGPMWFAVALLVFSLIYALIRAALPRAICTRRRLPDAGEIFLLGACLAFGTFALRIWWPVGAHYHNFEFAYAAQYAVLYAAGILAYRGDWVERFPARHGYRYLAGALVLSPVLWCLMQGVGFVLYGRAAFEGGPTWQSGLYALWESLFDVAVCIGLIVLYREKLPEHGRIGRLLTVNDYGVYVFHPPVLVALSLLAASLSIPPLAKFVVVSLTAFVATLALVHLVIRRLPPLNRVF